MRLESKGNGKANSVLGDASTNTDTRLKVSGNDFGHQIEAGTAPIYSATGLTLSMISVTGFMSLTGYAIYTKDVAQLQRSWDVTLGAIGLLVVLAGGRRLLRVLSNVLNPDIVKILRGVI